MRASNRYKLRLMGLVICLLVAAVLVAGLIFMYFSGVLEYQTYWFCTQTVDSAVQSEESIRAANKEVFDQMTFDNQLSTLLHYKTRSATDLLAALKQLNVYANANNFIDSIYIYNALDQTFYVSSKHSTQAVQTAGEMFDQGAVELMTHYADYDNMQPIARQVYVSYPSLETLNYVSYLRYNTLARPGESSVILINLRQEAYLQQFTRSLGDMETRIDLIDQAGVSQIATRDVPLLTDLSEQPHIRQVLAEQQREGFFHAVVNGQPSVVAYRKAFDDYWTLVYTVSEQSVASLFNTREKVLAMAGLMVLLMVLVNLAVLLTRRLIDNHNQQLKALEKAREDDAAMRYQERRRILLRLMTGAAAMPSDTARHLVDKAGLIFPEEEEKRIALLSIDSYEEVCAQSNLSDVETLKASLCGLAEAALKPLMALYFDRGHVAAVVREGQSPLEECLRELMEQAARELGVGLTAFISPPFRTPAEMAQRYQQMIGELPYKLLFGPGSIISDTMLSKRELMAVPLPEGQVKAIVGDIMNLDMERAKPALQSVLEEIATGSYKSFSVALSKLLATLDDAFTLLMSNNGCEDVQGVNVQLYNVTGMDTLKAMHESLCAVLDTTEKTVLERKSSKRDDLVNKVNELIAAHCADRDLCSDVIAGELGFSASYLSRLYKRHCGQSITEAILDARMDMARRLLATTGLQVSAIAERSGFSDGPYFYKVFKKMNGITPNAYRQSQRSGG